MEFGTADIVVIKVKKKGEFVFMRSSMFPGSNIGVINVLRFSSRGQKSTVTRKGCMVVEMIWGLPIMDPMLESRPKDLLLRKL